MTLMEQATKHGQRIRDALMRAHSESTDMEMLVMQAHREGFKEALDLLGVPEADTPMERIALAGGTIPVR